jgi:hypothetical protein
MLAPERLMSVLPLVLPLWFVLPGRAAEPLRAAGPEVDFAACTGPTLSLPADIEQAKKAVITVITPDGNGTGFIVQPDGRAVTAAHVVGDHKKVTVRFVSGLELEAAVVRSVPDRDLALIDVAGAGHPCLTVAERRADAGSEVYAIGSPLGTALAFSVSKGVVSGYPDMNAVTMLQTDASINKGNSGGPILSPSGAVLGVVSWKAVGETVEGVSFAVPAGRVRGTFGEEDRIIGGVVGGVLGGALGGLGVRTGPATLHVQTKHPDVTIGIARDMTGGASSQYGNVALYSTTVEDLCIAPCEKPIKPGVHTLIAYGPKVEAVRHKVELRPGEERFFEVRTRSKPVAMAGNAAVAVGATSAILGASFWGTGALVESGGSSDLGFTSAGRTTTLVSLGVVAAGVLVRQLTKPAWVEQKADTVVFGALSGSVPALGTPPSEAPAAPAEPKP